MKLILAVLCACVFAESAFAVPFGLGLTRNFPTGAGASGVVVDDFDRDGNLDFAVTQRNVDSLSVWLGLGAGKFAPPVRYLTGDFPVAIAAGDLNDDGRVDLVVVNGAANTVSFFRGGSFGTFFAKADYGVGTSPTGIAIGDLNGDSRPDAAVSNFVSNTVTVLVGGFPAGFDGTKFTVPTGSGPRGVAIGDINRDGINELITANTTADSVSVIPGKPGGFGPRTDYGITNDPSALAVGDVTGDGWPDVMVALSATNLVAFFRNINGTLSFDQGLAADSNPDAVVIAEIHGDNAPDVVVGHSSSGLVSVLSGNGSGLFTSPQSVSAGGSGVLALAVGDLDGDGRRDIVAPCLAPELTSVLYNNSSGPFYRLDFSLGLGPVAIAAGDLDGDADVDLAATNRTSGTITTLRNDGSGLFPDDTREDIFAPGASALVAADLNGDSLADLAITTSLTGASDTNRVSVFLNQGAGVFGAPADYDLGLAPRIGLGVGDLTNDGKLDLVTGHQNSTVLQVLPGNGLGTFATGPALTALNSPTTLHLADVNGGGLDVFAGASDGHVSAFVANGAGGFLPRVDYVTDSAVSAIVHADFDKDGKLDLAAANQASGTISLLRGNGLGGFTNAGTISVPGAPILSLAAGDFNGDGDIDLIAGRSDVNSGVLFGSGDGTFASSVPLDMGSPQVAMTTAFLDGNPSIDLLVAKQGGSASTMLARMRTRTTLVVTPNPSATGQSLTYQATVTKALPDSSNPTGTVRFFDGTTPLGSVALTNGVATLVQPGNFPWDRKLSAVYGGDVRFFGSISRTVDHFTYVPNVGVPAAPPSALALAPIGNPFAGPLRVRVSLAGTDPARLSLLDVRGRVLDTRTIADAGIVEFARALSPGVYLLRIAQGAHVAMARAVVL